MAITESGSKAVMTMNRLETTLFSFSTSQGSTNFHKLKQRNGCANVIPNNIAADHFRTYQSYGEYMNKPSPLVSSYMSIHHSIHETKFSLVADSTVISEAITKGKINDFLNSVR